MNIKTVSDVVFGGVVLAAFGMLVHGFFSGGVDEKILELNLWRLSQR